jgi:hypothetical protein
MFMGPSQRVFLGNQLLSLILMFTLIGCIEQSEVTSELTSSTAYRYFFTRDIVADELEKLDIPYKKDRYAIYFAPTDKAKVVSINRDVLDSISEFSVSDENWADEISKQLIKEKISFHRLEENNVKIIFLFDSDKYARVRIIVDMAFERVSQSK